MNCGCCGEIKLDKENPFCINCTAQIMTAPKALLCLILKLSERVNVVEAFINSIGRELEQLENQGLIQ